MKRQTKNREQNRVLCELRSDMDLPRLSVVISLETSLTGFGNASQKQSASGSWVSLLCDSGSALTLLGKKGAYSENLLSHVGMDVDTRLAAVHLSSALPACPPLTASTRFGQHHI